MNFLLKIVTSYFKILIKTIEDLYGCQTQLNVHVFQIYKCTVDLESLKIKYGFATFDIFRQTLGHLKQFVKKQ